MKIKNVIAAAMMGAMLTIFSSGNVAYGAPWVCPNEHNNCPGQEYCEEHIECVDNGDCIHQNSNSDYRTSGRRCGSHHNGRSGHHSR